MKIDLLITELFTGGAERCCAELARYLQEQGHSVRVISIAPAPVSNVDSLLYEPLARQPPGRLVLLQTPNPAGRRGPSRRTSSLAQPIGLVLALLS